MSTMTRRAPVRRIMCSNAPLSSCSLNAKHEIQCRCAEKILTGSFQGMLRIYHPKQSGQQVDDLMLETNLDAPILQLSVGRFAPYV